MRNISAPVLVGLVISSALFAQEKAQAQARSNNLSGVRVGVGSVHKEITGEDQGAPFRFLREAEVISAGLRIEMTGGHRTFVPIDFFPFDRINRYEYGFRVNAQASVADRTRSTFDNAADVFPGESSPHLARLDASATAGVDMMEFDLVGQVPCSIYIGARAAGEREIGDELDQERDRQSANLSGEFGGRCGIGSDGQLFVAVRKGVERSRNGDENESSSPTGIRAEASVWRLVGRLDVSPTQLKSLLDMRLLNDISLGAEISSDEVPEFDRALIDTFQLRQGRVNQASLYISVPIGSSRRR